MRTIIINTLGVGAPQYSLLFLPFPEDQLVWLDRPMNEIGTCVGEIEHLYNARDTRQDYRLVVLADLDGYAGVTEKRFEGCYRKILNAHITASLLCPLAKEKRIPPKGAAVIYLLSRLDKQEIACEADREYEIIFGLKQDQIIESLRIVRTLPNGKSEFTDITYLCGELLGSVNDSGQADGGSAQKTDVDYFVKSIEPEVLDIHQECSFVPLDPRDKGVLELQNLKFESTCPVRNMVWVDIQLNISEMLATQIERDDVVGLNITPHSERELAVKFRRARDRLVFMNDSAPRYQSYVVYKKSEGKGATDISGEIREGLQKEKNVLPADMMPGNAAKTQASSQKKGIIDMLRDAWKTVGRETKRFDSLCAQLEQEYDPAYTEQQQRKILNFCAEKYREFRSRQLLSKLDEPETSDETVSDLLEMDIAQKEKELHQLQIKCGSVTADKLEEYLDLRQEAEEIKADFRKASKLWMPDCGSSNSRIFVIYSVVLAVLFLIQMLLPYVGITLGQSGVELSRYLHLLASAAVFLGLYLVGLLIWMYQHAWELSRHREQMEDLIRRSSKRRRDSIENVINVYGKDLPECMFLYEELREMRRIDSVNRKRYDGYIAHRAMMRRADELLKELMTELKISDKTSSREEKVERKLEGFRFDEPPYAPQNISFYLVLSDKWEDEAC